MGTIIIQWLIIIPHPSIVMRLGCQIPKFHGHFTLAAYILCYESPTRVKWIDIGS